MSSENWEKVKALFVAAAEVEPKKRQRFLQNACGRDVELRREVEKLLASFEKADSFMENPAVGEVARVIVAEPQKPDRGQKLGFYEIVAQIGEGGMGEIYLAEDTRLKRKVALKLLAAHISEDKNRVKRFRQEALATSRLNHPNIVTIYEIGEWQGRDFIATEFIDGMTLRSVLQDKKLSIAEALDITLQIASALAAAHGAGIVHRDIKPENIMIRRDGLVKVLDFGIAKYLPDGDQQKALVETGVGEIIGTAAYMSPEQARGQEIDARTDIWSLGVILYEMIARKLPFPGETRADRIAAILGDEPVQLTRTHRKLPVEFEQVIENSLAKDKAERYPQIEAMAADLRRIRENSGINENPTFTMPSAKKPENFAWSQAVLALIILLLVGGGVWFFVSGGNIFGRKSALNLQSMKIERLSDTSQAVDVTITPDGEFAAFIKGEKGRQSLWLRQISAPSSVRIVSEADDVSFSSPVFSADGSYLYYLKSKSKNVRATLYQLPKLGGEEKKLIDDISLQDSGSNFSLSPVAPEVAFIRLDEGFNRSLVITDLDGTNERKLASRKVPYYLSGAAFSPDGKTITTITGRFGGKQALTLISTADATEKPLTETLWAEIIGFQWMSDGTGLIVSAAEKPGIIQLWHVAHPAGEVTRITKDLSDYGTPSLTRESTTIAAVQTIQNTHVWVNTPDKEEPAERQLTFGNGGKDGSLGISLTPDGGVVYSSQLDGNSDIWIVSADGSTTRQLTKDAGINLFPDVSPDGKYIVFNSNKSGQGEVWRMDLDGKNQVKLTDGSLPSFSPDGRWIFYYGVGELFKISTAGGEPVQIKIPERDLVTAPVVSPDNSLIACNYLVSGPNAEFRIGVLPAVGGQPVKIFDTFSFAINPLRWLPDNKSVTFIDTREGVSNIYRHTLGSEEPKQITDFKSGTIWNFDWSADGQRLALSRGTITKDVVLIRDFK